MCEESWTVKQNILSSSVTLTKAQTAQAKDIYIKTANKNTLFARFIKKLKKLKNLMKT